MLLLALAVALVGGTAVSTYFGIMAEGRAKLAQRNEKEADDANAVAQVARDAAEYEKRQSQMQSAGLLFDRGLETARKGEVGAGLHWMLESLRTTPDGADDFRRMVRCNLSAWAEQTCGLRYMLAMPDDVDAVAVSPDGKTFAAGCVCNEIQCWDAAP
ncbi:MAG TPA: hypothetical protein DDY78_11710 [Planctomycetales bacterium]|jgi:hypothetical protein|nr:hypothetical protein [Planctomycetales bacterium]